MSIEKVKNAKKMECKRPLYQRRKIRRITPAMEPRYCTRFRMAIRKRKGN